MRKFMCLLSVFKRSYIYCYIICMTVPLRFLHCNMSSGCSIWNVVNCMLCLLQLFDIQDFILLRKNLLLHTKICDMLQCFIKSNEPLLNTCFVQFGTDLTCVFDLLSWIFNNGWQTKISFYLLLYGSRRSFCHRISFGIGNFLDSDWV